VRWWALSAAAAVVAIASLGLLRPAPTPAPPPGTLAACPDRDTAAPQVAATGLQATVVARSAPDISITYSGQSLSSTPQLVPAGEGDLTVSADGLTSTTVRLAVTAFTPLLIDAQPDDAFLSVVVLGARCVSCPRPLGEVTIGSGPATAGALTRARLALSTGQWLAGATALSGASAADRRTTSFKRLVAAANAFGGHPLEAEGAVPQLLQLRRDAERADATRRAAWALDRWNQASEKISTLSRTFAADAPSATADAARRLDELSDVFKRAFDSHDVTEQVTIGESAQSVLTDVVQRLRAQRPSDCAWQARITHTQ
jgi:hypothetical protein